MKNYYLNYKEIKMYAEENGVEPNGDGFVIVTVKVDENYFDLTMLFDDENQSIDIEGWYLALDEGYYMREQKMTIEEIDICVKSLII